MSRRKRNPNVGLGVLLLALWPSLAAAQLDDTCMVSALNRTAPVRADGSWVLPNVPANQGPVRVRATCVANGVTRSGESDFIAIPANGTIDVTEIRFGDPTPIPVSLQLTAPAVRLETAGATVQLTATAVFADGTTADFTGASTAFRSSTPAVATVDAAGLVTAKSSGRTLLSATHEGVLGVLAVEVVVSGDSDGDGLPDDYEIAHGLDPNNPADALGDPDHDGLPNLEEFQLGTDPQQGDTDGDGLVDGDEVHLYHTDPLRFDTDGDGVSDGLEIRSGSDPLDPNSFNLGPILAAITVQPAVVNLVFNTVLGEASRRLDVKGRLIDGTTIDLRSRSRGTNYSSSDLSVASFGAEDGRVFAGQNGSAVVTVANNGFSATVPVNVTSFSPTALSFLAIPGYANGVDVSGDFVYVAAGQAGLVVVDAGNLTAPRIAGTADTPGNANDVKVSGGFAYVVDGRNGLVVVDVRDPAHPAIAGHAALPGTATDLALNGGRVYVAAGEAGLQIVDVTDPANPRLLGGIDTPGNARGVDADGTLAVVADDASGIAVFDVRDPAAPVLLGSTATRPNSESHAADVVLRGRYAYVADGADFNLGGLRVIDLQDPGTPALVGSTADSFALAGVALDGRLALAADYFFVNAVPIFDVGTPAPAFSAEIDFSKAPSFRDDNGNGIAVQNGVAYMVGTSGIEDNGVVGSGGLHIGRYRVLEDDDGIAPQVSITAPAAGASAIERSPLVVRADASDDFQVATVQFLIDGVPFFESTKSPYQAVVTVPAGVPSFTLSAVATDYGGNRGQAKPVVVSVVPDSRPQATLLSPVAGNRFTEGVTIDLAASASDDVRVDQVEFFVDGVSQGVIATPPYRLPFAVPVGAEQFTVQAVATDSAGQTGASEIVTVGIDDDPPPTVAVLAPTPGTQLVAGSRIAVGIGATDNVQVTRVLLAANGGDPLEDGAPPFGFSVVVPAGTSLTLAVTAEDNLGQQATAEAQYTVVPDPATTVTGRVIDAGGAGVAGATVICSGVSGTSGAGGTFSIPGVPTVQGRISCGASSTGAGGDLLEGRSAAVDPVPGGVTGVGDVAVVPHLLYLASGSGPDGFHAGRLLVLDPEGNRYLPWSANLPPTGLSGLAFDDQGRLFATTGRPAPVVTDILARPGARTKSAAGGGNGSSLLRLDPDTGAVLATIGTVKENGAFAVAVEDLTFDPATGRFYALSQDFRHTLYAVDPATANATPLATGLFYATAALAAGPDGLLDLLASTGSGISLSVIDPASGSVLFSDPVTGTTGASSGASVGGMTLRPGTGTFLLTAGNSETDLYELSPLARQIVPFSDPAGAVDGGLLGLAFRPVAESGGVVTTLAGLVVDGDHAPVAGAEVASLGAFGTTGADGRFELAGVRMRTGAARVSVRSGPDLAFSAAVPPVPNGVTDLGTITIGVPVCVTGRLSTFRCVSPVTVPLDLYVEAQDGSGQRTPVGPVFPDPTGRFCVDLRLGRRYFLRKEDFECFCGHVTPCETDLALSDPAASGVCGDPNAVCQDLGDVTMQCDFFCGGS